MGFFDKLKFWKKEEPFDYGALEKGHEPEHGEEFGADPTAGLGGTGTLGPLPSDEAMAEPVTITGRGFEGLKPTQIEERREGYARPQPMPSYGRPDVIGKDIEVVSAKLDAIRAGLESLNARMMNIENELQRLVRKGGGW